MTTVAGSGADAGERGPVLNGPFDPPECYAEIGPGGPTGEIRTGRRPSESWIPVPVTRKRRGSRPVQDSLDFDATGERRERNLLINDIRLAVGRWRLTYDGVTPTTRKLLQYWSDPARTEDRVLFCQREAVETAIYLAEVAGRRNQGNADFRRLVDEANAIHNAGLPRVALKMATGSGKTVVMAMLIAWQTLNHAQSPRDARFTNRFLVVTPGITIRNRLRVLLPSDDENYYKLRDLVPADLVGPLQTARISITNYHTFQQRDRPEIKGVAPRTRLLLTQGKATDPFKETDDDVVSRVLRDIGAERGGPQLMVLNDEAHHCYQDKPIEEKLDSESEERNVEARVWFKGLRAIHRKVGIKSIYDLSATPFYLGGSGYAEGYIFPWTVSDFSLMDAIESGIVKVPRLPIDDDAAGDVVTYLRLWDVVGKDLPKRRTKQAIDGLGWTIPAPLQGALESLYRSYERAWAHYEAELAVYGEPPPVFIVVCPNTVVSKLVYEWIAGADVPQPGSDKVVPKVGNLPLFSNVEGRRWVDRPRTLLIDSARLESGEVLSADFRSSAAAEIETFKAEYRRRYPGSDISKLTDEDLLREVMNTVGKPGRLGGDLRCVVSVSMLTEGWDANTVTHVLGIRAFTSQLLCEQVVGRGLRRRSYAINESGQFDPEYANVYGVPFTFIGNQPGSEPAPRPPALEVRTVEGREHLRIRFPKLDGYRLEIPDDELGFDLSDTPVLHVRQEDVALWTSVGGVLGVQEEIDLHEKYDPMRPQEVAYKIASEVTDVHLKMGADRRPWLFPRVVELTREWLSAKVQFDDNLSVGFLTLAEYLRLASEAVYHAIITSPGSARARLRPMLRPFDPVGDTGSVSFMTRKPAIETVKSEVSHVVLDGKGGNTWEATLADQCERLAAVAAYVKNDHVGLTIPYVHKGVTHSYVPDFLLRLVQRDGDVERTLIVEVSGSQKSPGPTAAKAHTARDQWCVAVNNHGGFGRWGYIEITDMVTARNDLEAAIEALYADAPISGDPDLLDAVL